MPQTSCTIFDCSDPAAPRPMAGFSLDQNGDGHLGYGYQYYRQPGAFALDPVHLPLTSEVQVVRRRKDGSYGVLSDAGPNAWGVKLTSSINRTLGREQPVTPVDWFLNSWHFGSGCIGFSTHRADPPNPGIKPAQVATLNARMVHAIEALSVDLDAPLDDEAIHLFAPGSSLGGVRPKTVVLHEGREYIAKFSRIDDRFDVPAVEYACLRMAHAAAISVPDFELIDVGGKSVLLVERFDRTEQGQRIHYLGANSLVDIDNVTRDQYSAAYSYAGIAEAMRPFNDRVQQDSHELFRRMVFNILIGNVDDHMRNHALLMAEPGQYRLAPAFDIVPHGDAAVMPQSIGVGAYGAASTMDNALSQCHRFYLAPAEACEIIRQVQEVVADWRQVLRECGVAATDIQTLRGCFNETEITATPS